MVGVRFSKFAEEKSAELADSLVGELMESPRTIAFRELDREALRSEYREFFQGLTRWLICHGQTDIEEHYRQKGRRRASQGVPLEQSVNAMLLCRDHLVQYLRCEAQWGRNEELFGELEFVVAVNHFFDDAIFFHMRGHKEHANEVGEVA